MGCCAPTMRPWQTMMDNGAPSDYSGKTAVSFQAREPSLEERSCSASQAELIRNEPDPSLNWAISFAVTAVVFCSIRIIAFSLIWLLCLSDLFDDPEQVYISLATAPGGIWKTYQAMIGFLFPGDLPCPFGRIAAWINFVLATIYVLTASIPLVWAGVALRRINRGDVGALPKWPWVVAVVFALLTVQPLAAGMLVTTLVFVRKWRKEVASNENLSVSRP